MRKRRSGYEYVLTLSLLAGVAFSPVRGQVSSSVVEIDWSRFKTMEAKDTLIQKLGLMSKAMANSLVDSWWSSSAAAGKEGNYVDFGNDERHIRTPGAVAKTIAWLLRFGLHEENRTGVSDAQALRRCLTVIKSLARDHKANGGINTAWGDQWQSALWAREIAMGAWFQWDKLEAVDREYVRKMVEHEANRFLGKTPPASNANSIKDTKGEENAWNGGCINMAAMMMPNHANAKAWRDKANEFHMTAVATPKDVSSSAKYDGKAVSEWVSGYCFTEEYAAGNHGAYPHPSYTLSSFLYDLRSIAYFSVAGKTAPEGALFNMSQIYHTFTGRIWSSPPYRSPGGTWFRDDGLVYWPISSELEYANRYYLWITYDMMAWVYGIDKGYASAYNFLRLHVGIVDKHFNYGTGDISLEGSYSKTSWCEKLTEAYIIGLMHENGIVNMPLPATGVSPGSHPGIPAHFGSHVSAGSHHAVRLDGRRSGESVSSSVLVPPAGARFQVKLGR